MSRRLVSLLGATGLLAAALALVPAVALAGDPCFHQFDNRPAPTTGESSRVILGDCVFTPTVNSVAVGTTVTWFNGSSQDHEVVGSNLTWGAHDKLLSPGDSIGWTFEAAGTYAYSCMIHPGMTGAIVVGTVAGIADAAAPVAESAAAVDTADGRDGSTTAAVAVAAGAGGTGIGLALAAFLSRRRASRSAAD
ncbi:MAG TPA: plastocyanin/azurin family copper-binding protein [Candidatus Limnocylindrales bacterium]|nr:plastocyanin/azurin family copper-binding protein [Candidatus Limnocylindrales bacterium]